VYRSARMSAFSDLTPATQRFQAIAEQVLGAEGLDLDPWLYTYCGSVRNQSGAARYVRHRADFLELGWPKHGHPVVVDAGSGFGFTLVVSVLMGAQRALGIEINQNMVDTVRAYLPLLPADISSKIEVAQGDVIRMPYEDSSADLLLSIEAISHYLDVDAFMDEARRVLRPGGVLVISDGNNGLNPKIRRETYDIWEAVENGPAGAEVRGLVLGDPYREVRRQLLEREFPSLSEETRAQIAAGTAGYVEAQVIAAARDFEATGKLPDSHYRRGQLAIAPDGAAMERLFSPPELARQLNGKGFEAKAYGYWGGAGGAPWIRAANSILSALSPLLMRTAPSFRIVARKV
jgi:SAM-dependent methyltransferase